MSDCPACKGTGVFSSVELEDRVLEMICGPCNGTGKVDLDSFIEKAMESLVTEEE